ncbi:hypothetical protein, partial [Ectopseudomonas toyotomiensis]|uniref:hypothetical protein n=1 Tax=Ectopseudomonas toyotomiensis TaxID=554344 RepID=UPI001ABF8BF1
FPFPCFKNTNAPNQSGRWIFLASVRFHTLWIAGLFYGSSHSLEAVRVDTPDWQICVRITY